MAILQEYYTSFVNQNNGRAGFQVKACSPGISSEAQDIISRLIVYRIPTGLDERVIANHPVALRYYYHDNQECILLCSQSCGSDENGRPGNFFAHSLVMSPRSFAYQPPILYWHSPFWRMEAPEINTLAPLPETSMVPSSALLEQMWAFLDGEGRRAAFKQLMCAVVHAKTTGRRIIIQDTDERVALWITAVSCMLPPTYRPLLSFSTYHHDPSQSWFLITGTNDPSNFSASPEASSSHFILDGQSLRTSEVERSSYANLVSALCNPQAYQKVLLQHFLEGEKRFPLPSSLDEGLEMFAIYSSLREKKGPIPLNNAWLPTIQVVLSSFEQMLPDEHDDEDKAELKLWMEILNEARDAATNPEIHKLYDRVRTLYHKHKFPSESILKNDLKYDTGMLIQEQYTIVAVTSLESLRETYGEVSFIDGANRPEYVKLLVGLTRGATARQMQAIWKNLGPYLQAGPAYQELFIDSLFLWGKLCEQKSADAEKLLLALKSGIAGRELNWFRLFLQPNKLSPIVITNFYWQCVQLLSLEARSEYRTIAMQLVPGLLENELILDLVQTAPQKQSIVLQQWVSYGKQTALLNPAVVISKGLPYVQRNKLHWQKLAAELLLNSEVVPYLGDWQGVLVRDLFADILLQHFAAEYIPLYKEYKGYPDLSEQQRAILTGLVSLSTHQLDESGVQQIHNYVSGLKNSDTYYAEVSSFLQYFLMTDISAEQHQQMVAALFVEKYEKSFWLSYWSIISTKLNRLLTNELECVLRLFSYWFALSPIQFLQEDQAYAVQGFFLELPRQLRNIQVQELPDAGRAFENMSSKAASYSWYPVMQELLVIRKKNIVEKGQELMRLMQQRLPNQKANTSEAEQELAAGIERLLRKGQIAESHMQDLLAIYRLHPQETFWNMYRERLFAIVRTNDGEHILEIFSFWFDRAFHILNQDPYIAQAFMIRLIPMLEVARKEQESHMRKIGHFLISNYQKGQGRLDCWYPLVHAFFYFEGKK